MPFDDIVEIFPGLEDSKVSGDRSGIANDDVCIVAHLERQRVRPSPPVSVEMLVKALAGKRAPCAMGCDVFLSGTECAQHVRSTAAAQHWKNSVGVHSVSLGFWLECVLSALDRRRRSALRLGSCEQKHLPFFWQRQNDRRASVWRCLETDPYLVVGSYLCLPSCSFLPFCISPYHQPRWLRPAAVNA